MTNEHDHTHHHHGHASGVAGAAVAPIPANAHTGHGNAGHGHAGHDHGAMVADTAPPDLRGTAYGLFNLASGLAMLVASVLAGWLWDRHGASATFIAGAVLASAACLGVLWRQRAAAR